MHASLNRRLPKVATPKLLAELERIGRAMCEPLRTESTKGRIVKRKIKAGHSYTYFFKSGPNSIELSRVNVLALQELGSLLIAISEGHDARKLFRQNERKKPKKTNEHQARAIAYWSMRALNPSAKDSAALRKARTVMAGGSELSDATLKKIAQKYREDALSVLSVKGVTFKLRNGQVVKPRGLERIAALREYLRRKSARHG